MMRDLPEPLQGLGDIAMNMAWAWTRDARKMFRALDPALWGEVRDDPLLLLERIDPARLEAAAADPEFMARFESVRGQIAILDSRSETWFASRFPELQDGLVAYFCAEFAVHHAVPIYSGGLGVLAGDHLKSASDLGVPMVAVGLFYRHGYFDQSFDDEGWQISHDEVLDPEVLPLVRVEGPEGPTVASVEIEGRSVDIGAWEMRVGRTRTLLLDTDLPSNTDDDRALTDRLYGIGDELRLKQEWVLGVGGVRALRAMGLAPGCWHANEGHAAFMMVERVREGLDAGEDLATSVARVRSRTVFTTHTPVPAGHDDFTVEQVEACVGPAWERMGLDRESFMRLGRAPGNGDDVFHMTAAAIRLSRRVNGVSAIHGIESRRMWKELWPGVDAADVPIGHITNGVHAWTWMADRIQVLFDRELGEGWAGRVSDPTVWDRVLEIDDARIWETHMSLKRDASRFLREQARRRWRAHWHEAVHLAASGPLLDPETLTLGFARRFATYKRADLLLRDEERLFRLLTDTHRPVQILFAGKAHPADEDGKRVLQRVHQLACDARAEGRVAFIEDYEMHLARRLFWGVDVWLNVPRVPLEASGTSGMKAAMNLVPQLGTRDGWWAEGYTGENGWMIPRAEEGADEDESDWAHLFRLLEEEVIPSYHDRDRRGVPAGWVRRMKHALWVAGRDFTTERMVRDYCEAYYAPALRGESAGDVAPTG